MVTRSDLQAEKPITIVAHRAAHLIGSACAFSIMARSALRSTREAEDTVAVLTFADVTPLRCLGVLTNHGATTLRVVALPRTRRSPGFVAIAL
jgi:hypothetical protein